jgi:hypothetical protein
MIFLVKINVNHSTRVMFVQYSFGTEAHTRTHPSTSLYSRTARVQCAHVRVRCLGAV